MKPLLLLLSICLLLFSCKKDASGNQLLWPCDIIQNLDSATTATNLIGAWRLVQQRSGWTGEVVMANKKVIVTFNSDSTFTVRENSSITVRGNWKLYMFSDKTWALDLTSPSNYLYGFISY